MSCMLRYGSYTWGLQEHGDIARYDGLLYGSDGGYIKDFMRKIGVYDAYMLRCVVIDKVVIVQFRKAHPSFDLAYPRVFQKELTPLVYSHMV